MRHYLIAWEMRCFAPTAAKHKHVTRAPVESPIVKAKDHIIPTRALVLQIPVFTTEVKGTREASTSNSMEATTRLSLSVENQQKSACIMWGFVSPIQEVRRYNHHPRTGLSALAERRHELREFANTETTHTRNRDASKLFSVEQTCCSHHSKKLSIYHANFEGKKA